MCFCNLPPSEGYARENNYPSGCYSISLRSLFYQIGKGSFPTWHPSTNKRAPLSSFPCIIICPSAFDCRVAALPGLPSFWGCSFNLMALLVLDYTGSERLPYNCLACSKQSDWECPKVYKYCDLEVLLGWLAKMCEQLSSIPGRLQVKTVTELVRN